MMILLNLFIEFLTVSSFTFGGAYGAIPLIRDMVLGNGWLTEEQLTHMIAVSESTPGPIMVNLATYIGSHQAGFWGSFVATLAVVLPSYLVILLVVCVLENAIRNPYVQAVLSGLKPCVTGIVLATGVSMVLRNALAGDFLEDLRPLIITGLLGTLLILWPKIFKKKLSPITLILISAVLGLVFY